jgi:hypothetical protein
MAFCQYHPDRLGIGICMRCRSVVCAACSTKLDGVNHCHACLKVLGQKGTTASTGVVPWRMAALLVLGLCGLSFLGLGWLIQGWFAP